MSAWLDEAIRAARDAADAPAVDAARTRARVARTLADRAGKRRARAPWLALAAALAVMGTAWAAGRTYPRVAALIAARDAEESAPSRDVSSAPRAPVGHAGAAAAREAREAPRADREEPRALPADSATQPASPVIHAPPAPPAPPASHAPPASPPSHAPPGPTLDALYEEAHALHFVARDPARALIAWDRYLARAPVDARAGLALEARYNRAICLVRLGRRDEARDALRPFADGAYGEYRRDEARALVRSLDAPSEGF